MGFAAPWFIAGLGLLALPLYLHLLKRHNATRQPFSSLMFFERSTDTSVRRRRLTHLLLLAARLALLALMAFAFSRPFLTAPAQAGGGDRLLLLVLDESASMGAGSRMEKARNEALTVLGQQPGSREVQVAAFASRFRLLGDPVRDAAQARAHLLSLRPTAGQSSYGEVANGLRTLARARQRPLEVHLFTDAQRTSMPPAFSALRLEPGTTLRLHDVAGTDDPNWFVEDVRAPGRLLNPARFRMEVMVAGANTPEAAKTVRLLANGKEIGRREVRIPAGGRATAAFEGLDVPYGFARCEALLDSGDILSSDDRFLFAVERSDPRPVLFVGGARGERSLLFLRNALEAAAPGAWRIEPGGADTLRTLGASSRYALVVLADSGPLGEAAEQRLRTAVEAGLPVLIVAGPAAAAAGSVPLTRDPVRSSLYMARGTSRFLTASSFDLSHPALEDAGRWEGVRFFQAAEAQPPAARVLVQLGDGLSLLYELRLGSGAVLVFTSALDNLANDLPSHPAFVAFADNAFKYLAGGASGVARGIVEESADLRAGGPVAAAEVLDPDGKRALSLEQSVKAGSVLLDRPGFWEIRQPGGRNRMIAANQSRRESDLTRIPPESAELWQGTPSNRSAADSSQPQREERKDLWPWILAAALAAAAAELYLASRHMRLEATA